MIDHDDLCPRLGMGLIPGTTCGYCALIGKVRSPGTEGSDD